MLKTIVFTPTASLKSIPSDYIACENNVVSILTPEGWKIPKEGDVIKETSANRWNVIGKVEITELAQSLNNILGATCPIDNIEKYYIDAFGFPSIKKAVAKIIAELKESDYNNSVKIRNLLQLMFWILQKD